MKITTLLKLVTLVVMLSTTPFAKADTYDFIIIHMKNGDKVLVNTNENPKISFSNQKISIGTEQFLISGISKYTFGGPTQNIDNTTVDIKCGRHAIDCVIFLNRALRTLLINNAKMTGSGNPATIL